MTGVLPSPSDHAEMPKRMVGRRLVRSCSCGKPWPCDQTQWNRLREEIQRERATHYERACDLADEGKDGDERAFGRVEECDYLLTVMDRMEADQ